MLLETFVNMLCYYNDDDCDVFKVVKCFSIVDVVGLNVVFTILH